MAEEYWNRGRREGIQQSSALDTLERLLGMGSDIAGRVQANRDKRGAAYITTIRNIINSNDYTKMIDNNVIYDNVERRLINMKDDISRADIDTQEFYKQVLGDIKAHKLGNTDYNLNVDAINDSELEISTFIDNYKINQMKVGQAEMANEIKNLKKLSDKHKKTKDYLLRNHQSRILQDDTFYTRILSMDETVKFFEDSILEPDNWLSENEYQPILEARRVGNYEPIALFKQTEAGYAGADKKIRESTIEGLEKEYYILKSISDDLFPSTTDVSYAISNYQQKILEKGDDFKKGIADWESYRDLALDRAADRGVDTNDDIIWESFREMHEYGPNKASLKLKELLDADKNYANINMNVGALSPSFYRQENLPSTREDIIPLSVRTSLNKGFKYITDNPDKYGKLSNIVKSNKNVNDIKSLYSSVKNEITYLNTQNRKREAFNLIKEFNEILKLMNENISTDRSAVNTNIKSLENIYPGVKSLTSKDLR